MRRSTKWVAPNSEVRTVAGELGFTDVIAAQKYIANKIRAVSNLVEHAAFTQRTIFFLLLCCLTESLAALS